MDLKHFGACWPIFLGLAIIFYLILLRGDDYRAKSIRQFKARTGKLPPFNFGCFPLIVTAGLVVLSLILMIMSLLCR